MSTKLRFLFRALRYRLRVDRAELRFVAEHLSPGQVAVDIGCHKGAYTYWLRRHVGPTGEVIAFEPQPRQVAYLQYAFAAMQYENVTLVPLGVSDAPGRMRLHIPTAAGATHAASFVTAKSGVRPCEAVDVEVTTLDAYFAGRPRGPDFFKIDVEGHELAVLVGASRTLELHHPTLLVECESRHRSDGDIHPVFTLLDSLGYSGSFFYKGRRLPLADFRPAEHQPPLPSTAKPPAGYVNNFAFEHPARKHDH